MSDNSSNNAVSSILPYLNQQTPNPQASNPALANVLPYTSQQRMGLPQSPQMATVTVPTHILNDPNVKMAVQNAQANYAKAASAIKVPSADPSSLDPNDIIAQQQKYKQNLFNTFRQAMNDPTFQTPSQKMAQEHPIANMIGNTFLGAAQGLRGTPLLSDKLNNEAQSQNNRMNMIADFAKSGNISPYEAFMMQMKGKTYNLAEDRLNNTIGNQSQTQWNGFMKNVNTMTASSRSGLGMAATGNVYVNRALSTLNNPKIKLTPQLLNGVIEDLARQYSGGVPTDQGMDQQAYNTIQQRFANLKQFLTSSPQDMDVPGIKEQLINTFNGIKDINNQTIKGNLDAMEAGQANLISKHQKEWQGFRSKIEGNNQMPGQQQIAASSGSPQQQTTQATQAGKIGKYSFS